MRKFLAIVLLVGVLVGCSAPESVKKADVLATKLTTAFIENNTKLVLRVADKYREQERKHIDFRIMVKLSNPELTEAKKEEIRAKGKAWKAQVDENYKAVLMKLQEIQGDLIKAARLRSKISEYLENEKSYEDLLKAVLVIGDKVAELR